MAWHLIIWLAVLLAGSEERFNREWKCWYDVGAQQQVCTNEVLWVVYNISDDHQLHVYQAEG